MQLGFTERTVFGKKNALLRKQGSVPVVCYGGSEESKSYSVYSKDLLSALSSENVVFETAGDISGKSVLLQDISYHPVSGEPLHADFLFVDTTHEVDYDVPIRVEGEPPAVRVHGGQMIVVLDKIGIRALPQRIPGHVTVSVSGLEEIGSHLLVSDIPLPEGVTLVTNPDEIIISITEQSQQGEEEETHEADLESIEVTSTRGKKEDQSSEDDSGE